MRDIFHDVTKFVSYNRGSVLGGLLIVGGLVLASCAPYDGKVVSSTTGNEVGRDELKAEYVQESRALESEWNSTTADKAALVIEYEGKLAAIDTHLDGIVDRSEQLDANFVTDNESINVEITNRNAKIGQAANLVQAVAPVPWLGPILGIALGGAVGGVTLDNIRKGRVIKDKKTELDQLKGAKS